MIDDVAGVVSCKNERVQNLTFIFSHGLLWTSFFGFLIQILTFKLNFSESRSEESRDLL